MKLSKDTKRVISVLNSTDPDLPNGFYDVNKISAHPSIKDIPGDAVWGILKTMERQGLVVFDAKHGTAVRKLELCRSYHQIRRAEIISFLCSSILVPVLVALITAFLTASFRSEIKEALTSILTQALKMFR